MRVARGTCGFFFCPYDRVSLTKSHTQCADADRQYVSLQQNVHERACQVEHGRKELQRADERSECVCRRHGRFAIRKAEIYKNRISILILVGVVFFLFELMLILFVIKTSYNNLILFQKPAAEAAL